MITEPYDALVDVMKKIEKNYPKEENTILAGAILVLAKEMGALAGHVRNLFDILIQTTNDKNVN